jgi:two-component system KDP operon response regulator KdpE
MTASAARILVVDDEPQITQVLRTSLTARGYEVRSADDGQSGLTAFRQWQPNLVITDLSMPRMGGIALCQAIRSSSSVPIVVLSVRDEEMTKVEALECGADDYVTKPFGMDELLARVRVALRRVAAKPTKANLLEAGDFRIDVSAHRTTVRGKEVYLTPKEFDLLACLLQNAGKVVTYKSLLVDVWGRKHTEDPDVVRVLVRQLRKKIEPNAAAPRYLKTEPWIGYRFQPGE